ncbi:MAG: DoxX family protein [bacterium]|nr:DoxX family protein [bacterium]MDT8366495.1 DoxX family protein [bacterium]
MIKKFFSTEESLKPLVIRVTLDAVMLPHGAQKALGLFGGGGFAATMKGMSQGMGIPAAVVFLIILSEFLGSIGLILGVATRFCAFGIFSIMTGAIFMVHLPNGFFMNWFGSHTGEGFEYHLLAIGMAVALMIAGGGKWSVDRFLAELAS